MIKLLNFWFMKSGLKSTAWWRLGGDGWRIYPVFGWCEKVAQLLMGHNFKFAAQKSAKHHTTVFNMFSVKLWIINTSGLRMWKWQLLENCVSKSPCGYQQFWSSTWISANRNEKNWTRPRSKIYYKKGLNTVSYCSSECMNVFE